MMSDHFVHAYNGCDGKSGQFVHPYHSAWMSHWTRKSYDAVVENHNCSSSSIRNKENSPATNDCQLAGKEIVSNICRPTKGLGEIESGIFRLRNETLKTTATSISTEKLEFQSFPRDVPRGNGENTTYIKDTLATSDTEELRHQINQDLDSDTPKLSLRKSSHPVLLTVAPDANKTPYKGCLFEPEGVMQNTQEPWANSSVSRDSRFAISRPLKKNLSSSTTDIVQCGFDHGNDRVTLFPSLMGRPAEASGEQLLPHTNLHCTESENLDFHTRSTFLVREEKTGSHSNSGRSLTSYLQQNKASLFQTGPSTSNNHLPVFGGELFSKMQNFSGIRLFQNQSNLSEATHTTEKFQHGYKSLYKFPYSLQDVETMRICTTVDSVAPLCRGHPGFSQTTHSLLITKKTDLNSYNEKQTLQSSRESGGFEANTFIDYQRVSPSFGHGQRGVKIQSLGGPTDSEGRQNVDDVMNPSGRFSNVEDVKALGNFLDRRGKKVQDDIQLKNESSAETDTMDIDDCANSSPSNQILRITPQHALHSTPREVNVELPDINLELPALPSVDNVEPSSSRTQSLDMEKLAVVHVEQRSCSQSDCCLGGFTKPERSNRWIKRLKLSASESSALGTKDSEGEECCHERSNMSPRIHKRSMANSEPVVSKLHGKELMVLDKTTALVKYGESSSMDDSRKDRDPLPSSMDTSRKDRDPLISLPWIQRWCQNRSTIPENKPKSVVYEPQSSVAIEENEEKQLLPSVAAMALMGKAMRGFQPCELHRRGPLVVWNTKGS